MTAARVATATERQRGCRLVLPAASPYDRQLLIQSIRWIVARWGAARVEVGRRVILVQPAPAAPDPRCASCGGAPGALRWRRGDGLTCVGCALDAALGASDWAAVGPSTSQPGGPQAAPREHSGPHGRRADAARPSIAGHRQ